jgi:hypothetical protein
VDTELIVSTRNAFLLSQLLKDKTLVLLPQFLNNSPIQSVPLDMLIPLQRPHGSVLEDQRPLLLVLPLLEIAKQHLPRLMELLKELLKILTNVDTIQMLTSTAHGQQEIQEYQVLSQFSQLLELGLNSILTATPLQQIVLTLQDYLQQFKLLLIN